MDSNLENVRIWLMSDRCKVSSIHYAYIYLSVCLSASNSQIPYGVQPHPPRDVIAANLQCRFFFSAGGGGSGFAAPMMLQQRGSVSCDRLHLAVVVWQQLYQMMMMMMAARSSTAAVAWTRDVHGIADVTFADNHRCRHDNESCALSKHSIAWLHIMQWFITNNKLILAHFIS